MKTATAPIPTEALPDDAPLTLAREYIQRRYSYAEGAATLVSWRDEFFRWDERTCGYAVLSKKQVRNELWNALPEIRCWTGRKGDRKARPCQPTPNAVSAIIEAMEALTCSAAESVPCWLDTHRPNPLDLISFRNGILNVAEFLRDKHISLTPPTPKYFCLTTLPYDFDRTAGCPQWHAFLLQALSNDLERIALLQEWFGYCLTTDTSQQKLMFLIGPPAAGKGTVTRAFKRCIGEDNCATPRLDEMSDGFGLQSLLNKTAAVVADAHVGRRTETAGVLDGILAITGQDAVNVQRKYLPPITNVRLGVRFTIGVNRMPRLPDASNAILRRLLMVPFQKSFAGKEDTTLDARLATECTGIMLWALDGLRRLRAAGSFTSVRASRRLVSDFRRQNSPVQAFIDDCCIVGDRKIRVTTAELFARWIRWCQDNHHDHGSTSTFGTALSSAATDNPIYRRRLGKRGQREWCYVGIGLRLGDALMNEDDDEDEEDEDSQLYESVS